MRRPGYGKLKFATIPLQALIARFIGPTWGPPGADTSLGLSKLFINSWREVTEHQNMKNNNENNNKSNEISHCNQKLEIYFIGKV